MLGQEGQLAALEADPGPPGLDTLLAEAGKLNAVRAIGLPGDLFAEASDRIVAAARDALIFPAAAGSHMSPSALYAVYHPARDKAGRPDLRFHDLRPPARCWPPLPARRWPS